MLYIRNMYLWLKNSYMHVYVCMSEQYNNYANIDLLMRSSQELDSK